MRLVTSIAIVILCVAIRAEKPMRRPSTLVDEQKRPENSDQEPLELVIDLANKFSDKFLGITGGDAKKTSVQSPLLNFLSLSMLFWGTVGSRRTILAKGLGFSGHDHQALKLGLQALTDRLNQIHENMDFDVNSKIYVPSQVSPNPPYIELIKNFYRASIDDDTSRSPTRRRNSISAFLAKFRRRSDQTGICVLLTTSLELRGAWTPEFDVTRTESRTFNVYGNAPVNTPTMYASGMFRYGKLKKGLFTFIELSYKSKNKGDSIRLYIIRPNDPSPEVYQRLINDFSKIDINELGKYPKVRVELYLPKLNIKTDFLSSEWIPRFFQPRNPFDSKDVASIILPYPFDLEFKDIYNEVSMAIDEQRGSNSALSSIYHKARKPRSVTSDRPKKFEVNIPFVGIVATTGPKSIKLLYFTVSGSDFIKRKSQ